MSAESKRLIAVSEDSQMAKIIQDEIVRQKNEINLIASENIVSKDVMAAMGSPLTNKYAEGYPGKRWYNGCDFVDQAEQLAIDRVKEIFGAEYANVQPHSGSGANMATYFALAKVGSTVLAMDLAHGGHLTHGSPANFSGKLYNIVPYGLSAKTEAIDYDKLQELANEHQPALIIAGASAYSRTLDFEAFRKIADSCGAKLMVDMAHIAGLVAAGCHPNPLPYADVVTSTTHKTLRGPRGGLILSRDTKYAKKINSQVFPGIQGGPLMHIIAAKAVAFGEALKPAFKSYQEKVVKHAAQLADDLKKRGLRVVSNGTDNHLFMLDVTARNISGAEAADRLQAAGIVVNKNAIPNDPRKITETSGVRIGSQLVTSRGFESAEFVKIAEWIDKALGTSPDLETMRQESAALASQFPIEP
jgi:glycine hydroxymethyltransferase